jgi:hypothetical protein
MAKIYLLVGVPGSGKTWVANQLKDKYSVLAHDDFKNTNNYIRSIIEYDKASLKPIIVETPFSMSQILEPLDAAGLDVTPVIIYDTPKQIAEQYFNREKKDIPQGHLTRNETYYMRAHNHGYFIGNSFQVLEHLKAL